MLGNPAIQIFRDDRTDIHNTDKRIQLLIKNVSQKTNVIWTSPLSDLNKVLAIKSFAMSLVLIYVVSEN